ncbi:helix-turn-helix transcriptional regulator [Microbacterium sp. cf332]|uniref:helix-turn-helix transcriptional regulator n=1 Tax=Microbacterium sp. cf332 TaxID=1761804 RepID=UPI0008895EE6|nr:helix-turn-helix transcriptional regulator [Microbacterium sp. cf332]SDQ28996.1 regulatory protein, luxR family [Microbacterium sp. cf332]
MRDGIDDLFAFAAEWGDPRLIARLLAADLEMSTAPELPSYAAELASLPPGAMRDAALAFVSLHTDADNERIVASARAAVSALEREDDLLASALASVAALFLMDRARWVDAAWFVDAAERATAHARAREGDTDAVAASWFRMMAPAVLIEWNTYDGTTRLDALSAALTVPRARNLLRSHHGPALVAMGQVLAARGEFGAGAVSIARGIPLFPPRSHLRASAQARLAYVKYRQGDWIGARRATRLVREGLQPTTVWSSALLAAIETLEPATGGDLATAVTRIEEATRALATQPSVQAEMVLLHARLAVAIGANDWLAMNRLLDDADEPGWRRVFTEHEWRALRGMALRNLGRTARYRELVESWADEPGADESSYYWAHVALLAHSGGDIDAALRAAYRSRELVSDGDDPLGRTWVRIVIGTIVSLLGDATDGMGSYEAARAELAAIGANGFVRLCTRIIEDVATQLTRSSGDALAALTAQQRRVAELVAEGFTSAEIAEILYLSKKTIDFHVANILSRLGLPSRRELVRWMGRVQETQAEASRPRSATSSVDSTL